MSTTVSTRASPDLLHRWRRQMAGPRRRRESRGPRPWAVIRYLPRGPIDDGLIDVRRLVFVILRDVRRENDSLACEFSGYRTSPIPGGVIIGGPELQRFERDLSLLPRRTSRGKRFDLADRELLAMALDMDRYLERCARHPHWPRLRQPRWPRLWAGMKPHIAQQVPCTESQRSLLGMTLLPLESVSERWQSFATVFADVKTLPRRQLVALDHAARNLCGVSGAIEYDLLHSRFSPRRVTNVS